VLLQGQGAAAVIAALRQESAELRTERDAEAQEANALAAELEAAVQAWEPTFGGYLL
jgi:hypothetical protein